MNSPSPIEAKYPLGKKRCTRCGATKGLHAFRWLVAKNGFQSWCKTCVRVQGAERRQTEQYRAMTTAYYQREDVQNRIREASKRLTNEPDRKAKKRAYDQTLRGRLAKSRRDARYRMKLSTNPETIARLKKTIELCDREIARLKAQ